MRSFHSQITKNKVGKQNSESGLAVRPSYVLKSRQLGSGGNVWSFRAAGKNDKSWFVKAADSTKTSAAMAAKIYFEGGKKPSLNDSGNQKP